MFLCILAHDSIQTEIDQIDSIYRLCSAEEKVNNSATAFQETVAENVQYFVTFSFIFDGKFRAQQHSTALR